MSKEELKDLYTKAYSELLKSGSNDIKQGHIYTLMWNEVPHYIELEAEGFYLNKDAEDFDVEDDEESYEYVEEEPKKIYTFESLYSQATMINFVEAFKDKAYILRDSEWPIIVLDHMIIYFSNYYHQICIVQKDPQLSDEIKNLIIDKKNDENNRWFGYVTNDSHGFNTTMMKVKNQNIDLEMNYNDDLPHDQIVEFIKSNKSGLILLHGEPGTGKTTYIRHLMYSLKGRNFMVLDSTTFNYITDASFIDLLMDHRNSVIILEDCESMLADRLTGNNQLSTLLNLSDGLVGDSFNLKFICTFNANVSKLDKALLRKGRMKVKYEFKNLTKEKTQALAKKIGKEIPEDKELPLSEIFNYGEDNGGKEEKKKIGFSK